MESTQLQQQLDTLIEAWENEVVEFKEANDNFRTDLIGKYFSALANEANLRGKEQAWLIFGVRDATRSVVGTNYRAEPERLHSLKHQIGSDTEPSITFREIHELQHEKGRIVMMDIPASPVGLPIAWKGHYYARAGSSLTSLGIDKQDQIRNQTLGADWTAQIVEAATLADLDPAAISKAKEAFSEKHANRISKDEVSRWNLPTFLERARLTRDGRITRAALLLLGKEEASACLSPHMAQLTWDLRGEERAYEHFGPPFLINTTELYHRIRNIQIRMLPPNSLMPVEVSKYDRRVVLEALNNCIAHQDYYRNARIVVTEYIDRLEFVNDGAFFEGSPDDYIEGKKLPRHYRNPFLARAMSLLNMIDTMGIGIHDMHARQARRYFPMPDYDLSERDAVTLTVHGRVVDSAYSEWLMQKTDLPLTDILALDRVQKKLPISQEAATRLRRAKLIEGRRPNLHISSAVAAAAGAKADYIRTRSQADAHFEKLLTDYLREYGECSRTEIDNLLRPVLGELLSDDGKTNKINNLLTKWRRSGVIVNLGSDRASRWTLAEKKS